MLAPWMGAPLLLPYGGKTEGASPAALGGGRLRGSAGLAEISSSPSFRLKPSPWRTAVPTRTCSTAPSGRTTATVTGSSWSPMGAASHRRADAVNPPVQVVTVPCQASQAAAGASSRPGPDQRPQPLQGPLHDVHRRPEAEAGVVSKAG